MGKPESRRNARVPCGAAVTLAGPRGIMRGTARDLSLGGFFFLGATLPVGRSFAFTLILDGSNINGVAEARFHHRFDDGAGMGVKFVRIEAEDLKLVQRWVAARL